MIELSKAIKTRYEAKSLDTSVGEFYNSRSPEKAVMPYVIYQEVAATVVQRSRVSEYSSVTVQWDVYCDDGDPETASDGLEAILAIMEYGERGAANPLNPTGLRILNSQLTLPVRVEEEGIDQVYRATAQQQYLVQRDLNRVPA